MNTQQNTQTQHKDKYALPAWKVILGAIKFRPWLWVLDLIAVTIFRVCWQVLPGLALREFFNNISGDAPARLNMAGVITLVAATYVGQIIGRWGFHFADVPLFNIISGWLRRNLLKNILRRPGAMPLADSAGEAISRFRGDVFEVPLFAIWINDILVGIVIVIGSILMMLSINAKATLWAMIPMLLGGIVANITSKRVKRYKEAARKAAGEVTGFIGEIFGAVQAVKVAQAESGVKQYFAQLSEKRQYSAIRASLFDKLLDSFYGNAADVATGIVLLVIASLIREETFTVGDFALFVTFLSNVSDLSLFYGQLIARYKQMNVSVERMGELMAGAPSDALISPEPVYLKGTLPELPEVKKHEEDRLHTLEMRGLSYHFPDSDNGIEDINLKLERGTMTVITGQVGSGKTTLLRVLLGLLPNDKGDILWNGQRVDDPDDWFIPPHCAYTGQVPRLFSATLRENILLGLERDESEIMNAAHLAVMDKDLDDLDDGLETSVGPKGVKLSGGQMQRTAAARMFVRQPELLVFDDLSSALDVETERQLWQRVFAQTDATMLAVSHRKPALRQADHIVVMQHGRIVAQGKRGDLLESCEEMRRLWYHGVNDIETHNGELPAM